MKYSTFIFDRFPGWDYVPSVEFSYWHWEDKSPYRPQTFAKLCGVSDEGLRAKLWTFEDNPMALYKDRDDPVYKDSCLELFLQPFEHRAEYVNFEINSKGVYLSQFGPTREPRTFIKDFCTGEPAITPFQINQDGKSAWGIEVLLSEVLLSEIFGEAFTVCEGSIRGNFYKCGDETPIPHYGACFPVTTALLGFHNPDCFGDIILCRKVKDCEQKFV